MWRCTRELDQKSFWKCYFFLSMEPISEVDSGKFSERSRSNRTLRRRIQEEVVGCLSKHLTWTVNWRNYNFLFFLSEVIATECDTWLQPRPGARFNVLPEWLAEQCYQSDNPWFFFMNVQSKRCGTMDAISRTLTAMGSKETLTFKALILLPTQETSKWSLRDQN